MHEEVESVKTRKNGVALHMNRGINVICELEK